MISVVCSSDLADQGELDAAIPIIREADGPVFYDIKVRAEDLDFALPTNDGVELKNRFRKAIVGEA